MNIFNDPRTIKPKRLTTAQRDVVGCLYAGPDCMTYRVIGWRKDDGPWIEEVEGRTHTRTINQIALGRTFHHHKQCPCRSET